MIVLSHFQAAELIRLRGKDTTVESSPDLGLTSVDVSLSNEVIFPGGETISWDTLSAIAKAENKCYRIENGQGNPIQEYSQAYGRVYTLYPTKCAPTMLVSGIPMHRIKDVNPWEDTQNKIQAFGRVGGHVLDTATGLGYTAILAAENADLVTTVELDPAAQDIARQNPWSQPFFEHPKITQVIGDSIDVIQEFNSSTFNGIIHDPPMFSLAGELYAFSFYQQVFRVLKPKGILFHYIGNPRSKSGARVTRGVVQRLSQAGFPRVVPKTRAFGVVAYK